MYAPVVDHIRAIGHHHLDPDTLGRLSAVGIDPESVKKNIECLGRPEAFLIDTEPLKALIEGIPTAA